MKVDVVKIIVLLAPVIKYLLDRKVPKNKINLYNKAAKSNDDVMDSLQDLAIKEAYISDEDEDENIFYGLQIKTCYGFDVDSSTGEVTLDTDRNFSESERDYYSTASVIPDDSDNPEFFRIMCVAHNPSAADRSKILVKIITGSNRVDGKVTNNRDVKDYVYYSVIVL